MTQPSGWYDDPQDPSQLRYWDGVIWSNNVTPKVSPTVQDSTIGMPYGMAPAAARPQAPGSHGAQGPHDSPQQAPMGQMPSYGQPYSSQSNKTTPDGVILSGWWKRVAARVIDNIIISIVALPLTFGPLQRAATSIQAFLDDVFAAAQAGSTTMPTTPDDFAGPLLQVSLIMLALYLIYEVAFLTRTGATLGRRAVGISVRLRDQPGPPPMAAVLKRTAVKQAGDIVGFVPVLGLLGSVFTLVDGLWPLWDDKKQAIHDKVGATNVVVGPQPKR